MNFSLEEARGSCRPSDSFIVRAHRGEQGNCLFTEPGLEEKKPLPGKESRLVVISFFMTDKGTSSFFFLFRLPEVSFKLLSKDFVYLHIRILYFPNYRKSNECFRSYGLQLFILLSQVAQFHDRIFAKKICSHYNSELSQIRVMTRKSEEAWSQNNDLESVSYPCKKIKINFLIKFIQPSTYWKLSKMQGNVEKCEKNTNLKTTRVSDYVRLSRVESILSVNLPKLFGNRCT